MKKHLTLLIFALLFIGIVGILIPILLIYTGLYRSIYITFEDLAPEGIFFFLYMISIIIFLPYLLSISATEKWWLGKKRSSRKFRRNRTLGYILLIIGVPVLTWLIIAAIRYYSITEFIGGLGEFVYNGFLVLSFMCVLFLVIPGLLLSLRRIEERS